MSDESANKKPTTAVFIDYDSWFWSTFRFGERPNLLWLQKQLSERCDMAICIAFAVFKNRRELQGERERLRELTSNIVDCADHYKEATDYTMLDWIYRTMIKRPDIEQIVVVTGDSHFAPTLEFLRHELGKKVAAIGVQKSMGGKLKETCNWYIEYEPNADMQQYRDPLLATMKWAEDRGIVPTFGRTVRNCALHYGYHQGALETMLRELIDNGIVEQRPLQLRNGSWSSGLYPRWDKIQLPLCLFKMVI